MQSFTPHIPLLTAASAFRLGRRRWNFPQECYLHCLCASLWLTIGLIVIERSFCRSLGLLVYALSMPSIPWSAAVCVPLCGYAVFCLSILNWGLWWYNGASSWCGGENIIIIINWAVLVMMLQFLFGCRCQWLRASCRQPRTSWPLLLLASTVS